MKIIEAYQVPETPSTVILKLPCSIEEEPAVKLIKKLDLEEVKEQ